MTWLDKYLEYTEDTESPKIFHTWTAITCVSSMLQKKVKFRAGRIKVYPNVYVVLVGPPGARKGQAIKYGKDILKLTEEAYISADSTTREMLIKDLEETHKITMMPGDEPFGHCSLTIMSSEFQSFLGEKKSNSSMINFLTDIFDCPEGTWNYRTIGRGANTITEPFVSLLAATTPIGLGTILPSMAIGGGLTSRILFIYAKEKEKLVPFPELTIKIKKLGEELLSELIEIGKIAGVYTLTNLARKNWIDWYKKDDSHENLRICKDPLFAGWYERRPLYIQKVSMILAAMRYRKLEVEWIDIELAIKLIEEVEKHMTQAFSSVGTSSVNIETTMVMNHIKFNKWIPETTLIRVVLRDVDNKLLAEIIATLIKAEYIVRDYYKSITYYIWKDNIKEWLKFKEKG